MSASLHSVGFGAPAEFGAHVFCVRIPQGRSGSVSIVEDFGYNGGGPGHPGREERVVLPRATWSAIADAVRREFNGRLKAAKQTIGRWQPGDNLLDRLLGRELCVLAWAAETATSEQILTICGKWAALRPEERWWLFAMTAGEAGESTDTHRGWRRALFHALSDGERVRPRTQARRGWSTSEECRFSLPLFRESE